jgi:hypothetical protein
MKSWCGAVQFFASYERQLDSSSHPKTLSHLFWFDDEQWAKITPVVRRQLLTHPIGARVGR